MKREDAFYYKNLLILGFSEEYEEWLNRSLESEEPLSDIVLELSSCGSEVKKAIAILNKYCIEQSFDEAVVCEKFRLFFKEAYYSDRLSKEEISAAMYRLACNVNDSSDFNADLWGSMYYFDEYFSLAKEDIISWESFDSAFLAYLDNGTPLDAEIIWKKNVKKKPSMLERIKRLFKR